MNELRVREAADTIGDRKAALKWLEENTAGIDVRSRDHVEVSVRLNRGSALPGAAEAQKQVAAFIRFVLPEVFETAKRACRNDIELAKAAIREEMEKADNEPA